jgi:hypothetical protein
LDNVCPSSMPVLSGLTPQHPFPTRRLEQEEVAIETQQCPILLRTILGTLYSSKKKE